MIDGVSDTAGDSLLSSLPTRFLLNGDVIRWKKLGSGDDVLGAGRYDCEFWRELRISDVWLFRMILLWHTKQGESSIKLTKARSFLGTYDLRKFAANTCPVLCLF